MVAAPDTPPPPFSGDRPSGPHASPLGQSAADEQRFTQVPAQDGFESTHWSFTSQTSPSAQSPEAPLPGPSQLWKIWRLPPQANASASRRIDRDMLP
jgi:hypothetical protein